MEGFHQLDWYRRQIESQWPGAVEARGRRSRHRARNPCEPSQPLLCIVGVLSTVVQWMSASPTVSWDFLPCWRTLSSTISFFPVPWLPKGIMDNDSPFLFRTSTLIGPEMMWEEWRDSLKTSPCCDYQQWPGCELVWRRCCSLPNGVPAGRAAFCGQGFLPGQSTVRSSGSLEQNTSLVRIK